jgi:hypothetical protein
VPTVKDIGLWGPQVQEAFAAMGAIEFAGVDAGALLENDARVAEEFDAHTRLRDAEIPPPAPARAGLSGENISALSTNALVG